MTEGTDVTLPRSEQRAKVMLDWLYQESNVESGEWLEVADFLPTQKTSASARRRPR